MTIFVPLIHKFLIHKIFTMHSMLKWLALPCCLTLFTACEGDEFVIPTQPQEETGRRTVLMYVSAQNSLGYKNFQKHDSLEIVNGKNFIDENDRLLVFMDDESAPRLYQYTRNDKAPKLVRQWKNDVNSASPQVLQEVLTWTRTNFPAEEYGLVMWSHSDGWIPSVNKNYALMTGAQTYSFGIDVGADGSMKYDRDDEGNIGAQMDIDDMAAAIQQSGMKLKYIFFDSCLMQNVEVCYSLRNVTDYVIAAPMQIPGCGANYTHLLEKGLFTEAENDIAMVYANDAKEGLYDKGNEYYDFGLVISTIRTDKMEALAQTTADVLTRSKLTNKTSVDMENTLYYQPYTSIYFNRPHNYDAQEAMRLLLSESDFERYEKALNEAIVNKATTEKFWKGPDYNDMQYVDSNRFSGISMFVPQDAYTKVAENCIYGDLNLRFKDTPWYKAAGWAATGW